MSRARASLNITSSPKVFITQDWCPGCRSINGQRAVYSSITSRRADCRSINKQKEVRKIELAVRGDFRRDVHLKKLFLRLKCTN